MRASFVHNFNESKTMKSIETHESIEKENVQLTAFKMILQSLF